MISSLNKRIAKLLGENEKQIDALITGYENNQLLSYKQALKEIQAELHRLFAKYDKPTLAELHTFNRVYNLEKNISHRILQLMNESKGNITEAIKNSYSTSYYSFAKTIAATVNIQYGMLDEKKVQSAILNPVDKIRWPNRLKEHANVLNKNIREEITQGIIQGKGYSKISEKIVNHLSISASKTNRIVRTETHRASSMGRQLSFEDVKLSADRVGIKMKKIWITTLDARTRDLHAEMDNVEADDDGYFTLPDGTRTLEPGLTGIAEHDINCRCTSGVIII